MCVAYICLFETFSSLHHVVYTPYVKITLVYICMHLYCYMQIVLIYIMCMSVYTWMQVHSSGLYTGYSLVILYIITGHACY